MASISFLSAGLIPRRQDEIIEGYSPNAGVFQAATRDAIPVPFALPTRVMEREAIAAGLYETPFEKVPKIQIITLAELFQGIRPRIPRIDVGATFRTAAREKVQVQERLL
jgi:hypothetical protein